MHAYAGHHYAGDHDGWCLLSPTHIAYCNCTEVTVALSHVSVSANPTKLQTYVMCACGFLLTGVLSVAISTGCIHVYLSVQNNSQGECLQKQSALSI